jgi:acyl-CoA thioester hydrolase
MIDENMLLKFADATTMGFWSEQKVRYQDLDTNGHVNNISYLAYVECARIEYRATVTSRFPEEPTGAWVIAATAIKFLHPAHYPGSIRIGTTPFHVGRTSFSLGYGLFQGDTCVAVAGSRTVQVDRDTGKPMALPGWLREFLLADIA